MRKTIKNIIPEARHRLMPCSVLTNRDKAMRNAIKNIIPGARHRLIYKEDEEKLKNPNSDLFRFFNISNLPKWLQT